MPYPGFDPETGAREPLHLAWPAVQVMALPRERLVCVPIAKNACTTLKAMMVGLSDLSDAEKARITADVHRITDSEATGLLLKDLGEARAREVLAQPGTMAFAVLRDPVDRLVSAYVEKFVIRRERKRVATAPVIAAIRGREPGDADFARGIRFAEFADYVLATPATELDPHWRPQVASLAYAPCTHLYAMEDLGLLEADLSAHLGRPVATGARNRARARPARVVEGAAAMWPEELPEPGRLHADSFVDARMRASIGEYYAADLTLWRAARREADLRRALASAADAVGPSAPRPWRKRLSVNGLRRALGV